MCLHEFPIIMILIYIFLNHFHVLFFIPPNNTLFVLLCTIIYADQYILLRDCLIATPVANTIKFGLTKVSEWMPWVNLKNPYVTVISHVKACCRLYCTSSLEINLENKTWRGITNQSSNYVFFRFLNIRIGLFRNLIVFSMTYKVVVWFMIWGTYISCLVLLYTHTPSEHLTDNHIEMI